MSDVNGVTLKSTDFCYDVFSVIPSKKADTIDEVNQSESSDENEVDKGSMHEI